MSTTTARVGGAPFAASLFAKADPTLARIALAMALSLVVTVPALLLDDRVLQGEAVWLKPIKFQIALTVYFATLALYAAWLPPAVLRRPAMRRFLAAVAIATTAEMAWVIGAAMFAQASHFNTDPLFFALYAVMGLFAALLTSVSLVFGIAFLRDRDSALPEALRLSLALGLVLTFGLTLLVAGTLSSMSGHHVGVPVHGHRVPLMGWSREVGDLRVSHFLATHALHVVPAFGLVALGIADAQRGRRLVWAGAFGFVALTLFTFVQALSGRPFL